MPADPELTYAPVKIRKKRWIVRTSVLLLLAAATLLMGSTWQRLWLQMGLDYDQWLCLHYENPNKSGQAAAGWPACWVSLKRELDGPSAIVTNCPTLFCGRLSNERGESRLVVIQALSGTIYFAVLEPRWVRPPSFLHRGALTPGSPVAGLTFSYATRDPAHSNHLTVDQFGATGSSTLDCWLTADDLVAIEPRNGSPVAEGHWDARNKMYLSR